MDGRVHSTELSRGCEVSSHSWLCCPALSGLPKVVLLLLSLLTLVINVLLCPGFQSHAPVIDFPEIAVDLKESMSHSVTHVVMNANVWRCKSYRNWRMCPRSEGQRVQMSHVLEHMLNHGCLACLQWAVKPGSILGLAVEWKTEVGDFCFSLTLSEQTAASWTYCRKHRGHSSGWLVFLSL